MWAASLSWCPTCLSDSWASQVFSSISLRWGGGASRTFRNRSWAWRPHSWQTPCSTSSTRERMYVWLERNWNSSWHLGEHGKHLDVKSPNFQYFFNMNSRKLFLAFHKHREAVVFFLRSTEITVLISDKIPARRSEVSHLDWVTWIWLLRITWGNWISNLNRQRDQRRHRRNTFYQLKEFSRSSSEGAGSDAVLFLKDTKTLQHSSTLQYHSTVRIITVMWVWSEDLETTTIRKD